MFFGEPFGGIIPGAQGAALGTLLRTDSPLTGRQVYRLLSDDYSLWSVQEALKTLVRLGIVNSQQVGSANVHTVNEEHAAVAPLRLILSPLAMLQDVIEPVATFGVTVILFGSIARGEATHESDVDLAVIAPPAWDERGDLQETVRARLGNDCEVLVFTADEFGSLRTSGEPVVAEILRDGIALTGSLPAGHHGVA